MSNELSLGTNLINNNDCLCFGQLLWPSSGKRLAWVVSIYKHAHNQTVSSTKILLAVIKADIISLLLYLSDAATYGNATTSTGSDAQTPDSCM